MRRRGAGHAASLLSTGWVARRPASSRDPLSVSAAPRGPHCLVGRRSGSLPARADV